MSESAIWHQLGNVYLRLGACQEAVAAYDRARSLDPQAEVPYLSLAQAYHLQGDYEQAVRICQQGLAAGPDRNAPELIAVWNLLGDAYRQLREYENAMAAYRQADAILDGRAQSRPPEADSPATAPSARAGDQPLDVDGSTPGTISNGLVNWLHDLIEGEAQPDPGEMDEDLGDWLQNQSAGMPEAPAGQGGAPEPPAPETVWKPPVLEAAGPGSQAAAPQSREVLLAEAPAPAQETEATTAYSPADENHAEPGESPSVLPAGRTADGMSKLEQSVAIYEKITQDAPTNDKAWFTLGRLLQEAGRYDQAAAAFENAIAVYPDRDIYHYQLGLVYTTQGRHEEAAAAFARAVDVDPGCIPAHCALAGSYRRLGREEDAAGHIEVARPHMHDENEYDRACFESISGNTEEALHLLAVALDKKPGLLAWARCDPDLDFVREAPGFQQLVGEHD
jgi:tetratricopeptide (TPR) repeat protein